MGHATVRRGDSVRTGVTAILPHAGNLFQEKVPAAVFVGNGFGKLIIVSCRRGKNSQARKRFFFKMSYNIKFIVFPPKGDRIHYVTEEDIKVVLNRLPEELWSRLRAVHFNDQSKGARILGYITGARREIALCALPPRVSLTTSLRRGLSPRRFGAKRGCQWPRLAVRRFMLYDTFLHELGHLQIVAEKAKSGDRQFAMEKLSHEFSECRRKKLWSEHFDHPDPAHNPPSREELAALEDNT